MHAGPKGAADPFRPRNWPSHLGPLALARNLPAKRIRDWLSCIQFSRWPASRLVGPTFDQTVESAVEPVQSRRTMALSLQWYLQWWLRLGLASSRMPLQNHDAHANLPISRRRERTSRRGRAVPLSARSPRADVAPPSSAAPRRAGQGT